MQSILPDLLTVGLRVVFCGTAAGNTSAFRKAYYAHSANKFWETLFAIGLTDRLFEAHEYASLSDLGIGLTDICKFASGNDDELPPGTLKDDELTAKILKFQPKMVAFTSKTAGKVFFRRKISWGLQPDQIGQTRFYVLPSTSPRARRTWAKHEYLWHELAGKL